jgi:hypothetical protein
MVQLNLKPATNRDGRQNGMSTALSFRPQTNSIRRMLAPKHLSFGVSFRFDR